MLWMGDVEVARSRIGGGTMGMGEVRGGGGAREQ